MLPVGRERFRVRSSDLEGSCDALGTADPRAQKSRPSSGTCRNHGSTKRMHSESTGLDRYSERKERGELECDCAGMHAGGSYTRSNALLIAYGAPVPCGHVFSTYFFRVRATKLMIS